MPSAYVAEARERQGRISELLVFDRHLLTIDPGAPSGVYQVEVGLYDPESGERYPVSGPGADLPNRRLLLAEVAVK
jgi:hypothetical protein